MGDVINFPENQELVRYIEASQTEDVNPPYEEVFEVFLDLALHITEEEGISLADLRPFVYRDGEEFIVRIEY